MKILIFGKADFDIVQLKEKLKVEPKESRFAGLEVKYRILPDFLDRNFSINFSLKLYFYTIFSINCLIYNLNLGFSPSEFSIGFAPMLSLFACIGLFIVVTAVIAVVVASVVAGICSHSIFML